MKNWLPADRTRHVTTRDISQTMFRLGRLKTVGATLRLAPFAVAAAGPLVVTVTVWTIMLVLPHPEQNAIADKTSRVGCIAAILNCIPTSA
jgi:hypothetical protein